MTLTPGHLKSDVRGNSVWTRTCVCSSRDVAVDFSIRLHQGLRLRESSSLTFIRNGCVQSKRSRQGKQNQELRTNVSRNQRVLRKPKSKRKTGEDLFLICRYASLGHPNNMGALIYTEAIKGQLLQLLDKAGWKRDTNSHLTLQ